MAEPFSTPDRAQLRMTEPEIDAFLAEQRVCRVATCSEDGPHVTPMWFTWLRGSIWLYSLAASRRWSDVLARPRLSVVVDAGSLFGELRGVELRGTAVPVGEIPRVGEPLPELDDVERSHARIYRSSDHMLHDGTHAWLRLTPDVIASWDFRKHPTRETLR